MITWNALQKIALKTKLTTKEKVMTESEFLTLKNAYDAGFNTALSMMLGFEANLIKPKEFVNMVIGKESLIGKPVVFSMWPNKE